MSVEESGRRAAGRTVEGVCMTEIERPVLTAMFNPVVYPENLRDAAAVDAAETDLQHPLVALDGAVSRSA
jgi:hypothetical protein